jgi:hypothetical protein
MSQKPILADADEQLHSSFHQRDLQPPNTVEKGSPTAAKPSVETRKKIEIQFDRDVRALLAAGRTHEQLILRLRQLVLAEAEAGVLPPRKVIYSASYGGFAINDMFKKHLQSFTSIGCSEHEFDCARDDPAIIKAIGDFGRSVCDELPYVLADFRTSKKWGLRELMKNQAFCSLVDVENGFDQHPDLVTGAKAFYERRKSDRGQQQLTNDRDDFVAFARSNPDRWMQHEVLMHLHGGFEPFAESLGFAHELLAKDSAKYRTGPDEQRDTAIYEHVGLLAASTSLNKLAIAQVPALVDYKIVEYDGLESVRF